MNQIMLNQHNEIEVPGFKLGKKGLEIIGTPKFELWKEAGNLIRQAEGSVHWWIGDWLNYGKRAYGEQFSQAIDKFKYGTLANDRWVCSRIARPRRREGLSFGHHVNVADFEPEDQDILLDKAIEGHLSVSQHRTVIRYYKIELELPEVKNRLSKEVMEAEFDKVKQAVEINCCLLEELAKLDIEHLIPQVRDYLFSQLKKTVGTLANILNKYEDKSHLPA